MPEITQEYLNECFKYNPGTGDLLWRTDRPLRHFKNKTGQNIFNGRNAGKIAGNVSYTGVGKNYILIPVHGKTQKAHRMIWILLYGSVKEIDHINGDGTDNKLSNLREVNHHQNLKNKRLQKNNKSGHSGVAYDKNLKKWLARIGVSGKTIYLGWYSEKNAAINARKDAEKEHGYHENHGQDRPL